MSIKKNNTYFEKNNGKVYYIDGGIKTDVPSSAFGDIDNKIATKLDTSAFSNVSGTFYTIDNPSGFIDNTVNDLVNYYTQTEINEMLADFGGFEVVSLTTGENPVPDVPSDKRSTKIIYLTKDSESQAKDPYTEWIFTSADVSTTAWEVIGETTVDLSNYYTTAQTSGSQELADAFNAKQDKLTAGTDLVINSGIISVNTDGIVIGTYAFAEGSGTSAAGNCSHAEGANTSAAGDFSHAEGSGTYAVGSASHAEGVLTTAVGGYSHAEGNRTSAGEYFSHAEGNGAKALGYASHAEGQGTRAAGDDSHAEGFFTSALGDYSHTEGGSTKANGPYSHAEGNYTVAGDSAMHVGGKYNQTSSNAAFVIGNGSANDSRSDAFIVNWNGKASASILATSGISDVESAISTKLDSSIYTTDSATFYTTANVSGFITGVDLTPYQTIAGMTAYQPSGNYMSANALDSISGTWNEVSAKVDTSAIFTGSTPGLVPSAAPSDSAKALLGDGTWGVIGGGGVNMSASYDSATETFSIDFSNGGN